MDLFAYDKDLRHERVNDLISPLKVSPSRVTAQKMKFSTKDSFSKCDQIRRYLRIWSHLLKKSIIENFIFWAVKVVWHRWRLGLSSSSVLLLLYIILSSYSLQYHLIILSSYHSLQYTRIFVLFNSNFYLTLIFVTYLMVEIEYWSNILGRSFNVPHLQVT